MTPSFRKEMLAICEAASPRPWLPDVDDGMWTGKFYLPDGRTTCAFEWAGDSPDLALVVAATAALPMALGDAERLDAQLENTLAVAKRAVTFAEDGGREITQLREALRALLRRIDRREPSGLHWGADAVEDIERARKLAR